MNENSKLRRALAFVVPLALIAALTWYAIDDRRRAAVAPAQEVVDVQGSAVAAYPPAWPHAPSVAPGADQIELCGHGLVAVDAFPADVEEGADMGLLRSAQALQRSAVASERVLGFATAAIVASSRVYTAAFQADKDCVTSKSCRERADLAAARAAVPAAEGLARLAVTSRDPLVYASALAACRLAAGAPELNVCSALRAEQWALLDPDNAQAWFEVARAANERKDARAVDEAMQRAARSAALLLRTPPFHDLLAAQPRPADAIEAMTVARVLDVHWRWLMPVADRAGASDYCTREAVADPGRKQLCSELATLLTEKDATLLGVLNGIHIGVNTGWSADRAATQRARARALSEALKRDAPDRHLLSCDGAARAQTWAAHALRVGELEYARRLAAGGDTTQARR